MMPSAPPGWSEDELRRVELFRAVEIRTVESLLRHCPVRRVEPGEVLIEGGASNRYLYFVLAGRLSVRLEGLDSEPIAHIETGETVGELSLIDNQPASADVVAESACRVMVVDEQIMWMLVNTSHAVSSNLLYLLARRLRDGNAVISQDRGTMDDLRFHATVDSLTGLFNRFWLDQMLPRLVERARQDGAPLSALMIDIDHFKQYNDGHGHLAGDAALRRVARSLADNLRPADMAARYGGEEFAVLLPGTTVIAGRRVAERLRDAVAAATVAGEDGRALPGVSVSVGVAQLPGDGSASGLLAASDAALYEAKAAGRNRVAG